VYLTDDYLWLNNLHGTNALLDDPDMSVPLKKDISMYLYRSILGNVSFLKDASPDVVIRLCSLLVLEVYMPNEYVFAKGDRGRNLYIIKRGKVSVLRNDVGQKDDLLASLDQNMFFGETALLSGIGRGHGGHRACTVRAVSITELLTLSIESFNTIVKEFPSFKEEMIQLSLRRKSKNGENINMNSIDLGKGIIKRASTWVNDDQGSAATSVASSGFGSGGALNNSAQLTSLIRACMLEMRRDLEHNLNDRLSSLEDRLNDTMEHLNQAAVA